MTKSIAEIEQRISELKKKEAGVNGDNSNYMAYLDGMVDALLWAIGEQPRLEV